MVCLNLKVSERKVCRTLEASRTTQRREPKVPQDEARLVKRMVELATRYGRLRLPTDMETTSAGGISSESPEEPGAARQAYRATLATRRTEGPEATAEASSPVDQRWFVLQTPGRASESSLELRLRDGSHQRWSGSEDADYRGRIHQGMPGDRCRASLEVR